MSETKNKKILWIEDDHYHLKGLTRPLAKDGFEIIAAKSYIQAVSELDKHKNDLCLILLDLIIPRSLTDTIEPTESEEDFQNKIETPHDLVENGMELLNYIKKKLLLTIPIIVLSIVRNEDIIKRLENSGVKRLPKLGLLPNELKQSVIDELSI
jgi:CheY-like chemotaxis protein